MVKKGQTFTSGQRSEFVKGIYLACKGKVWHFSEFSVSCNDKYLCKFQMCRHACVCVYVCVGACGCVLVRERELEFACVNVWMYSYVCECVRVCIFVCASVYTV